MMHRRKEKAMFHSLPLPPLRLPLSDIVSLSFFQSFSFSFISTFNKLFLTAFKKRMFLRLKCNREVEREKVSKFANQEIIGDLNSSFQKQWKQKACCRS